jgi:hypothetical protein
VLLPLADSINLLEVSFCPISDAMPPAGGVGFLGLPSSFNRLATVQQPFAEAGETPRVVGLKCSIAASRSACVVGPVGHLRNAAPARCPSSGAAGST